MDIDQVGGVSFVVVVCSICSNTYYILHLCPLLPPCFVPVEGSASWLVSSEGVGVLPFSRFLTMYLVSVWGRAGVMMVFPFIFGHPRWLYLLLFFAFVIAGFLFNWFLRHSLRNGPRWGKSSTVRSVDSLRRSLVSSSRSRPVPSSRPAPVSSTRPAAGPSLVVPRFGYCRRYPDLLVLCGGDVVRADRLVDLESKSSPSAAPDAWVNLAISRFSAGR